MPEVAGGSSSGGDRPAPTPDAGRAFAKLLTTLLFLWGSGLVVIVALTMRSPGSGVWETGASQRWTGTLVAEPYPMLVPDGESQPGAMLVVAMGKYGAHERLGPHFGQRVALTGYELRREGRRMIELDAGEDAVELIGPASSPGGDGLIRDPKRRLLVGEIVDGKCYLGAMKPGDGMGHRTCAMLCLRGGLPPMFVQRTEHGHVVYSLLVVDGSCALGEQTLSLVGRRVIVDGRAGWLNGLRVLETGAANIKPHDFDEPVPTYSP